MLGVGVDYLVKDHMEEPETSGADGPGTDVLLWGGGLTREEAEAFLLEHCSNLWRPLLRLLSLFGTHIG